MAHESHTTRSTATRPLPRSLILFSSLMTIFGLLSLASPTWDFIVHHSTDQLQTYLWPALPGYDFYDYQVRIRSLGQPDFFDLPGYPWYYPAPGAIAYDLFYHLCPGGNWRIGYFVFGCIALAGCVFAALRLSTAIEKLGYSRYSAQNVVFSGLLFSWPIFISLQRGNLESIFWLILAAAIWMLGREQWFRAAVLLGIASAFKLYPALCFGLFLRTRRWKELVTGILTMVLVTLIGLRYMQPNILFAAKKVSTAVQKWTSVYAQGTSASQMMYDHSLYEIVKAVPPHTHPFTLYLACTAIGMTLLFFTRILRQPRANQVLFLIVASVLIPPASIDYTLQSVYIAWAWIAIEVAAPGPDRGLWPSVLMTLFALELAPLAFMQHHGISIGGVLKGLGLIALIVIAALVPMNHGTRWQVARSPKPQLA